MSQIGLPESMTRDEAYVAGVANGRKQAISEIRHELNVSYEGGRGTPWILRVLERVESR